MARKRSATLTDAEYRLMDILWYRQSATVGEVVDALPKDLGLAYNTVLTTLRILEQKGYVRHKASGRAFIYFPKIGREDAQRQVVDHVVSRFFNNSPRELVVNLLESERLDDAELLRLQQIIESARTSERDKTA